MDFVSLVSLLKKHVEKPFLAPTHLPPKNRQVIFADFVNFPDFFLENSAIGKIRIYVCTYYIGMYVGIVTLQIFCLFFFKKSGKILFADNFFLPNFFKKSAKNIA